MLRAEGGQRQGKTREFQAVLLKWRPKEIWDQWRIKVLIQVHYRYSIYEVPLTCAMQLGSMLRLEGGEGNGNKPVSRNEKRIYRLRVPCYTSHKTSKQSSK